MWKTRTRATTSASRIPPTMTRVFVFAFATSRGRYTVGRFSTTLRRSAISPRSSSLWSIASVNKELRDWMEATITSQPAGVPSLTTVVQPLFQLFENVADDRQQPVPLSALLLNALPKRLDVSRQFL